MYRVISRDIIRGNRLGKYIVEFSFKWPEETKHLYLVSVFSSFFPGRYELTREGDRGKITVKLWEGVYPYKFSTTCGMTLLDEENPLKARIKIWPDSNSEEEFSLALIGTSDYESALEVKGLLPELIIHDEGDPTFISYYLGYTVVRLKTPKNLVKKVFLETEEKKRYEMKRFYQNKYSAFFQGIIEGHVNAYRFLLETDAGREYFGNDGLYSEEFIRPGRVLEIRKPYWFIGSFYYLIFPDSFIVEKLSLEGHRPRSILGGKLRNITSSLDYLSELGVDAIYLTPVYKAASYHRYDVIDHESLDDNLGNWNDWWELVKEAERRNIKIVVDIVAHHLSPCSREFQEAVRNDSSNYHEWFRFIRRPEKDELEALQEVIDRDCKYFPSELRGRVPFYETFLCNWGMPKLNYSNPRVRERLSSLALYWLEKGAKGLRIDVGHAIPDDALKIMYEKVKDSCEDCIVILEISKGVSFYPYGYTSDSAMNYDLRALLLDFYLNKRIDAYDFIDRVKELYTSIPISAANSMYNLLGSHDTPRIATLASTQNKACLETLYATLFILPGAPSIYYGDEVGMLGGDDPDNRQPMLWDEEKWDRKLMCLIKRLGWMRRTLKSLRLGFFDAEVINNESFIIHRWWEDEDILALFSRETRVVYEPPIDYIDFLRQRRVERVELEPYSWNILIKKRK
ncbi:alpha-amylase family glycosyl hydrolase [Infirmifilum uzonense]|uniref:alpha-amylase family glycosyl hydrolase n=1 Tax=Infirmifilum uzonense TaxID=1550241 RepID=UPI003C716D90